MPNLVKKKTEATTFVDGRAKPILAVVLKGNRSKNKIKNKNDMAVVCKGKY